MDTKLKSYLDNFIEDFGLKICDKDLSINFEYFSCYSIVSNSLIGSSLSLSEIEDMSLGENKGIDSASFIVNNKLITSIKELEDIFEKENSSANIDIIFIQSKISESCKESEFLLFIDTVDDFLSDKPNYTMNDEANKYHDILLYIYQNIRLIKTFNVKLYYSYTGLWNDDTSIRKMIDKKEENLNRKNDFKNGECKIIPHDRIQLCKLYRKITDPINTEFILHKYSKLDVLPDGVEQTYIGIIDFNEFKNIILDPDTNKIRSLFYDNIRDDLGIDNPVNKKISETLDKQEFSLFPLLNNGITIISEKNNGRDNIFKLENYQIVNGCQTSHVIYNHMTDSEIEKLSLPIKIIITTNEEIRDKIIIATNQQTEIREEQLIALNQFQKNLEDYYKSMRHGIFYERRVNQYKNDTQIKKKDIVDIREQIKSFVAIFIEEPHEVSGFFGKIYKKNLDSLFKDNHKPNAYYFAGLIQQKFKKLIAMEKIDKKYNKFRYYIFMLFRKINETTEFDMQLLTKKDQQYFDNLISILEIDEKDILLKFKQATDIIDSSGIEVNDLKEIYKKSTTNALLNVFKERYK